MQLETIKKSLQEDIIGSFWSMLRELETQADNENAVLLKRQVEGWYHQWNKMTSSERQPLWITREENRRRDSQEAEKD